MQKMTMLNALLVTKDVETQIYRLWTNAISNGNEKALGEINRMLGRIIAEFKTVNYPREAFRARIVYSMNIKEIVVTDRNSLFSGRSGLNGFPAAQMGPPPKDKATGGRANRPNESLLYLASNVQTACAEVQPTCGDLLSVAAFTINAGLSIIDLRALPESLETFSDKDDVEKLCDILFGRSLIEFFSMPINAKETELYLFSQKIAEYCHQGGADGILYPSSHNGDDDAFNMVLFDPQKATCSQRYGDLYKCLSKKSVFQNISVNSRKDNVELYEAERIRNPFLWNEAALFHQELKKLQEEAKA